MTLAWEVRLVWQPVNGGAWLAPLRVPIKNDCYVSRDDAEWNREGGIARALVGTLAPSAVEIVPCPLARVVACRADEHDKTAAVHVDVSVCDDQPPMRGRLVFALVQNGRRRGRDGGAWRAIDETPCRYDGCECGLKEPAVQVRPEVLEVLDDGALLRVGLQFNEVSSHRAANPDSTRSFSDYDGGFTGFLWLRATWIADTDGNAQPAIHRLCTAGPLITLEKYGNKYRTELAAVGALHLLGKRTRSRMSSTMATTLAGPAATEEDEDSDAVPPPPKLPSTDEWASAIVPRQPRTTTSTLPFCVSVSLMRRVVSSHEQRVEGWHMVTERTAPTLPFGTLHEPTQTHAVCCLDVEFSRRVRNTSSSRRFRCMTIDTIVPVCIARWWDGSKIAAAGNGDQQLMVELCWPQQGSFDDPQFDATMPLQYSEPYRVVVQCAPDADGPWSVLPVQVAACTYSDRDTVRIPVDVSAFRYAPVYFRMHVSNGDAEQFIDVPSVLYGDCLDTVPSLSAALIASDRVTTLLPCCEGYEVVEAQPSPPPPPPSSAPDTSMPTVKAKRPRNTSHVPPHGTATKRAKPALPPPPSPALALDEFLDTRCDESVLCDASNVEAAERDALRAIARYYRAQYLRATAT